MDPIPVNPESNRLKSGMTLEQVGAAVKASGYPLQITVSALLRSSYTVQEEWAYNDRITGQTRAIDMVAQAELSEEDPNKYRVRPTLVLIIECKQSDLPYTFFMSEKKVYPKFPLVAGLTSEYVEVIAEDDRVAWRFPILDALELSRHPFIVGPPISYTFSKCARKGSQLQLSGSDAYNQLIMPIMSAMHHFWSRANINRERYWFDAFLVLGIAVVDAPMIAVNVARDSTNLEFVPWVRVLRHEPSAEDLTVQAHVGDLFAIDVIHSDFLEDYLSHHARPFADQFRVRAHRHHEELVTGKGFISNLSPSAFTNIESRLQPREPSPPPPSAHAPLTENEATDDSDSGSE
jgi:hypothetical protein